MSSDRPKTPHLPSKSEVQYAAGQKGLDPSLLMGLSLDVLGNLTLDKLIPLQGDEGIPDDSVELPAVGSYSGRFDAVDASLDDLDEEETELATYTVTSNDIEEGTEATAVVSKVIVSKNEDNFVDYKVPSGESHNIGIALKGVNIELGTGSNLYINLVSEGVTIRSTATYGSITLNTASFNCLFNQVRIQVSGDIKVNLGDVNSRMVKIIRTS